MKKTLLKELILPSFWLFFFIVSPKNDQSTQLKKGNGTELEKQDDIYAVAEKNKIKQAGFTKAEFTRAVYLSGF